MRLYFIVGFVISVDGEELIPNPASILAYIPSLKHPYISQSFSDQFKSIHQREVQLRYMNGSARYFAMLLALIAVFVALDALAVDVRQD